MRFQMITNPVDKTKPNEVYEVVVTRRERLGDAIYIAKELTIREFSIKRQLASSDLRQLVKIARLYFSKDFAALIGLEKAKQAYLKDYPNHRFEWIDDSE